MTYHQHHQNPIEAFKLNVDGIVFNISALDKGEQQTVLYRVADFFRNASEVEKKAIRNKMWDSDDLIFEEKPEFPINYVGKMTHYEGMKAN
jgi:hypothetical protein